MNFLNASVKGSWRFGRSGRRSLIRAILALGESLNSEPFRRSGHHGEPPRRSGSDTVNRMPTLLFLVRHGETEWSRSGQHTSTTDLPLTETGKELARALKGHLSPQDFQLILSSPRRRARETAELAGFVGSTNRKSTTILLSGSTVTMRARPAGRSGRRSQVGPSGTARFPVARRLRRSPAGSTEWLLGFAIPAWIGRSARSRPCVAGADHALARVRPQPRGALSARHGHGLGTG